MKSLKLNELNRQKMAERQLNNIKGGEAKRPPNASCGCGCCFVEQGGSSTNSNGHANASSALISTGCEIKVWYTFANEL